MSATIYHFGAEEREKSDRALVDGKMPTDRPIDGVDQTDVLLGNSAVGHRESLLSFIGGDLVAARWKQWRIYFTDVHPTGSGPAAGARP
jgi:hypothetical protein